MKKLLSAILVILTVLMIFTSCNTTPSDGKKTYKIGICNYVDDASLNQIIESIETQLAALGEENNVNFEVKVDNCNTDSAVMGQIISNFTVGNVDLMVGVATPVAMKMQNETEDSQIPVVFAAVSDPVGAGLVDSMEKPGHNLTGTSDYLNTAAIIDLMLAQNPDMKKVGLLYDIGQDSSTAAIADAKKIFNEKNIEIVEKTGTNAEEVTIAVQTLISSGVEAIFTPTDNTIMKCELAIYEMMADAKIPHYTGADSFALNGAFLGYGVDYVNLGKETANMIADILINGKNPAEYPVKSFDNGRATINSEICEKLGYNIEEIEALFKPMCTDFQTLTTSEYFE